MSEVRKLRNNPLSAEHREATASWLAAQQRSDGSIHWSTYGKYDPWDHLHCAMGLTLAGRVDAARAAFAHIVRTQEADGAWISEIRQGRVTNPGHETNHAAYLATALWYFYRARRDLDFLAAMWPALDRAIEFVVALQDESGAISWIINEEGEEWKAPILSGSASIHGSLVCAERIAARLGHDRPHWRRTREALARVFREDIARFERVDLPEGPGRFSMDWYYPVLGGALRGDAGRARLLDPHLSATFLVEGIGLRCVVKNQWYTAAETCEYVLALDACGLTSRARQIFSWVHPFRNERGAYWTGLGYPARVPYPPNEETTYTSATILMAADALAGDSPTSSFFRDLAGDDLAGEERSPLAGGAPRG
jgi:hypothetical protein